MIAQSKRAMSRSKSSLLAERASPDLQLEMELEDAIDSEDGVAVNVAFESGSEEGKSEGEEELERLVFGDSTGFRQNLKTPAKELQLLEDTEATGLEGLDDADLFMTDLQPAEGANLALAVTDTDDDPSLRSRHAPVWEDSDDERIMVSLASVPRLRKLRITEAEDVVNGKEYSKRLRRQFELLNPVPEWARQAIEQPARKRRRLSGDSSADDNGSDEEMDVDGDDLSAAPLSKLLRNADSLVRPSSSGKGRKRKLRAEVLDIQRAKDIAMTQPSSINSLSFHPTLPLLLSSGPSATLYLHHVTPSPPAPTPKPLLTSLHVRGTPLTTSAFHPTDTRIFFSSRRRYFHIWNLNTGKVEKITRVYGQQHEQRSMERFKLSPDGNLMALLGSARKGGGVINILSAKSLQWLSQVRVESRGGIAEFAWWNDSNGLCIAGKSGEVTEWSVVTKGIVARWQDEGAVGTTTLELGGKHDITSSSIGLDRWIAIGSSSGIVNVYDRQAWLTAAEANADQPIPSQPRPTRMLDHLTTPTSNIAFSPDGQILAISSKWKPNALRLVHLPSCTVYRNWPTSSTPLGRVTIAKFAAGNVVGEDVHSLLAVANEQGKIRMWEIR